MTILTDNDKRTLTNLMENNLLDKVVTEIQHDISLEIINTESDELAHRHYLYVLAKALEEVKGKLQECVNETLFQEDE